ncbi:MAG: hypothetical protein A4E37_01920 [Methanoregulaceae archaeon PtaB.Bin056]|jgi:hypothetical protein|nr:MAG: hypothetical protein A4E37_01920 [Methanoregulaceae archaeon PtaB.Bin056]
MKGPILRIEENEDYLQKLVKLIPAEALSAYLVLINLAAADANKNLATFIIGLGIVIGVRLLGTMDPANHNLPNIPLLVVSLIGYPIWVYNIGGSASGIFKTHFDLYVGTSLMVLFTIFSPYLYSGGDTVAKALGKRWFTPKT